jgi:hypothetical protein
LISATATIPERERTDSESGSSEHVGLLDSLPAIATLADVPWLRMSMLFSRYTVSLSLSGKPRVPKAAPSAFLCRRK